MSDDARPTVIQRLAALRRHHAHRYDPVRFEYLEGLARRSRPHADEAYTETLQARLDNFEHDLDRARQQSKAAIREADTDLGERLHGHHDLGDYKAVLRLAGIRRRNTGPSSLTRLTQSLHDGAPTAEADASALDALLREQHQRLQADHRGVNGATPKRDLRALAAVRASRARRHTARRIDDALARPTGDAGPLNSHRQVVRALDRLQTIAPGYLERFVDYLDTLMTLEKAAPKS